MRPALPTRRTTRTLAGALVCSLALVALLAGHHAPAPAHHPRHAVALAVTAADPGTGTTRPDAAVLLGTPRPAAILAAWVGTADSATTPIVRTASHQPARGPPIDAAV